MNIITFDIETVPDLELGKKLYGIGHLNDEDGLKALQFLHNQQKPNSKLLPHFLHKIVAISLILKTNSSFKIWSLGTPSSDEPELISRFFEGLAKFTPILISWNGSNFDLPVIIYRALKHGISSRTFWDTGQTSSDFKWNNYLNRYHERHTDLMDMLARFSPQAYAKLDTISTMLDLPGKMDVDGSQVSDLYQQGKIEAIRDYCELDVLNTYLIFLRFELIRNHYSSSDYDDAITEVQEYLQSTKKEHFLQYLSKWNEAIKK